ncbi:hypothetical protein J6590_083393 [Homalodisca vitripennis]|nr:hypothetical protein J6590_083393 [Homalodisca vitripennis]
MKDKRLKWNTPNSVALYTREARKGSLHNDTRPLPRYSVASLEWLIRKERGVAQMCPCYYDSPRVFKDERSPVENHNVVIRSLTEKNIIVKNPEKFAFLRKGKGNGPSHVFGEHGNCEPYFCIGIPKEREINNVPEMKGERDWNRQAKQQKVLQLSAPTSSNADYGPNAQKPCGAKSNEWLEERRARLTASNFGLVCRRKAHSRCIPVVKQLLYTHVDCASTKYGQTYESTAIAVLKKRDHELPSLADSPAGLVGDEDIVEVVSSFNKPPLARNSTRKPDFILKSGQARPRDEGVVDIAASSHLGLEQWDIGRGKTIEDPFRSCCKNTI